MNLGFGLMAEGVESSLGRMEWKKITANNIETVDLCMCTGFTLKP